MINGHVINGAPINGSAGFAVIDVVSETAVITSAATDSPIREQVVTETAVVSNPEPIDVLATIVTESAVVTSSIDASVTFVHIVTDSSTKAVSSVFDEVVSSTVVTETAVVTGTASEYNISDVVYETAVTTSSAVDDLTGIQDVVETAVVLSNVYETSYMVVTETAVVTDNVVEYVFSGDIVYETAVASSTIDSRLTSRDDVVETAVVTSTLVESGTLFDDVVSTGHLFSWAWSYVAGAASTIYTANTHVWAMSTYEGLDLTYIGQRFSVGPSGLWEKADQQADAYLVTGHTDFGSRQLKRMSYVYTYGSSVAPVLITVVGDVTNGVEAEHTYTAMARDATSHRAVRTSLGRGFRSSYYQLKVQSDGALDLLSISPEVDVLSRRI